ncbi:YjcQ family protein [Faecalibacterium sp. 9]|uniref:YjcQ family protein n=1 Tax=Faecalibacterium sp. 9 TaxID=3402018 RepID=UPI003AAC8E5A
MEDFRIIYRILKFLQQSMDFEDFDSEGFNAERFGTNPNRFQALLIQLQRAGYIEGLDIVQYIRQPAPIPIRTTTSSISTLISCPAWKQGRKI